MLQYVLLNAYNIHWKFMYSFLFWLINIFLRFWLLNVNSKNVSDFRYINVISFVLKNLFANYRIAFADNQTLPTAYVPIDSKRKELENAETKSENPYKKNGTEKLSRTHSKN